MTGLQAKITVPLTQVAGGAEEQEAASWRWPWHPWLVHLTSHHDQARVELCISGYQFPGVEAREERDWDANWLRVSGVVAQADGKAWTFDDPCLTTWEAEELGSWLSNVAAGTVPPSPFRAGQPEKLLVFTEPNLAFGLEAREGDRLRIRVHFSLEALPP